MNRQIQKLMDRRDFHLAQLKIPPSFHKAQAEKFTAAIEALREVGEIPEETVHATAVEKLKGLRKLVEQDGPEKVKKGGNISIARYAHTHIRELAKQYPTRAEAAVAMKEDLERQGEGPLHLKSIWAALDKAKAATGVKFREKRSGRPSGASRASRSRHAAVTGVRPLDYLRRLFAGINGTKLTLDEVVARLQAESVPMDFSPRTPRQVLGVVLGSMRKNKELKGDGETGYMATSKLQEAPPIPLDAS